MIVEFIIRVYNFDEPHEHAYEHEHALMHKYLGVMVQRGKWRSCIWIWTCIFEYDDWSPWLTNTMMLGLNDWICWIKCLVDATTLWCICYPWIYIARWTVGFYAMDECGIDATLIAKCMLVCVWVWNAMLNVSLMRLRHKTQWVEVDLWFGGFWVPNTFLKSYLNSEPIFW